MWLCGREAFCDRDRVEAAAAVVVVVVVVVKEEERKATRKMVGLPYFHKTVILLPKMEGRERDRERRAREDGNGYHLLNKD